MLQPTFFPMDKHAVADRPAAETVQVLRVRMGEVGGPRGFSAILDRFHPRSPAAPDRRPPAAAPKPPAGERASSMSHGPSTSSLRSNRAREMASVREPAADESAPTRWDKLLTFNNEPNEAMARAQDESPRETAETTQADSPDDLAALYVSLTVSIGGETLVHAVSVQTASPEEDLAVGSVAHALSVSIDTAAPLQLVTEDVTSGLVHSTESRSAGGDGLVIPAELLDEFEGVDSSALDAIGHEQAASGGPVTEQAQELSYQTEKPSSEKGPTLGNVAGLTLGTVEGETSTDRTTLSAVPASEGAVERQPPAAPREVTRPSDVTQPRLADVPHQVSGDPVGLGPVEAHQLASDSFQSGGGQGSSMDGRGEQGAGPRSDTPAPGAARLAGASGFGDTVAAQQSVERGLSSEGTGLRSAAPGQAGRLAGPQAWPDGDERSPLIQAVSLDLEPADLGPVNVRIFMMDRTVHAHIRTEHADLGQGMLAHQHQLEVKLQHSGLEMGELRVTVDQQQLTREDTQGWLRQQSEGPAAMSQSEARGVESEEPSEGLMPTRRSGIMSFFA